MYQLTDAEKAAKAALLETVTRAFEGRAYADRPENPYFGAPREQAEKEAEIFLASRDPTLGQDPQEPGKAIRRIDASSEEQVMLRLRDATSYEP